jgi:15-cis-phytoene synthase
MSDGPARVARQILAHHSKSFAFAGRFLPAGCREDATALYAWCRRCDDAVDRPSGVVARAVAVDRLRSELDRVYGPATERVGEGDGDGSETELVLAGFQRVVRRRAIPRCYADDLVDGMAMDVGWVRYRTFDDLLLYCYRVAGTVGLMMAHIMGVRSPPALRRATDLGIAMQLTNICRDVAEDQRRDRVYLPQDLLAACRAHSREGHETGRAVEELLRRADGFYRSGDQGIGELPIRCAIAIRAARLIYAEIGREIARRGFDVRAGRAVVSRGRKAWLALRAAVETLWTRLGARAFGRGFRRDLPAHRPRRLPFSLPIGPTEDSPTEVFAARARS